MRIKRVFIKVELIVQGVSFKDLQKNNKSVCKSILHL